MIEGNRKCRESMLSPNAPSIKLYRTMERAVGFTYFITGLQDYRLNAVNPDEPGIEREPRTSRVHGKIHDTADRSPRT